MKFNRVILKLWTFVMVLVLCMTFTAAQAHYDNYDPEDPYRPQYHYTPKLNWMNDPNGLVYNEETEEYHLFYQACDTYEEDQNEKFWGHAVSKDLVHWQELGIALSPSKKLGSMWSGSIVIDKNNTSGFFDAEDPPGARMVAFVTMAGGESADEYGFEKQGLAYSSDNGITWTMYEGNPIIAGKKNGAEIYGGGFRDPKVIWYEDANMENGGIWLMTVAGGPARLFTSSNLIDWEYQSTLGYSNGSMVESECPDFFPLTVEGSDEVKWVYSAAGRGYVVGDLKYENGKFLFRALTSSQQALMPLPTDMYAAQTFYNDPQGRRIAMYWMLDLSSKTEHELTGTKLWDGVQSLPLELKLYKDDNGKYQVRATVVEEVNTLRSEQPIFKIENASLDGLREINEVSGKLLYIDMILDVGSAARFDLNVFVGGGYFTTICYNIKTGNLILSRRNSGGFVKETASTKISPDENGLVHLEVYLDNSVVDVFSEMADTSLHGLVFTEPESTGISIEAKDGSVELKHLKIYEMNSALKEAQNNPVYDVVPTPSVPAKSGGVVLGWGSSILIILGSCLLSVSGVALVMLRKPKGKIRIPSAAVIFIVLTVVFLSIAIITLIVYLNGNEDKGGSDMNQSNVSGDTVYNGLPADKQGVEYWKGKKVAFLGDSITELNGYQGKVDRFMNLNNVTSYGVSGTTISGTGQSFTQRAPGIKEGFDLIFVFGGTNDFHIGTPLGSAGDEPNTETFCGAVRLLCEQLTEAHPDTLIVFATPLQRTCFPGTNSELNSQGVKCSAYADAIIEVCGDFNIPVLDFYNTSEITEKTAHKYLYDGLHPNDDGFLVIAKEITKFFCPDWTES